MKHAIAGAVIVCTILSNSKCLAYYNPSVNHDGWQFVFSTPFGLKEHTYQVVSKADGHPVRFGKHSERFEVRPGDCGVTENGHHSDCATDRERSEMDSQLYQKFYDGDEYWYRWSIFFPLDHNNLYPIHLTYGQFKQIGCDPVFSFIEAAWGIDPDNQEFRAYTTAKYVVSPQVRWWTTLEKDYRGKWLDIVVHAKWDHTNGWYKVWLNGKQTVDYKGKTLFCYKGLYFKYGIYKTDISRIPSEANKTIVVYYDGMRISKTRNGMFGSLPE